MTTRTIEVTTDRGRRLTVVEHTAWIDTGSKTGSGKVPGRKSIKLQDGTGVATDDGKVFVLRSGETFRISGD